MPSSSAFFVALLFVGCAIGPSRFADAGETHDAGLATSCRQTCSGCCDENGVCQAGSVAVQCGRGASYCVACNSGQTCQLGVCAVPPESGDGEKCSTATALIFTPVDAGFFAHVEGDTTGHTDDDTVQSRCGGADAGDLVYSFAAQEGDLLDVTLTPDSALHPVLKARTVGQCGIQDNACNTRPTSVATGFSWSVPQTGTQYLVVDGANSTAGTFKLDVTLMTSVPIGTCLAPKMVSLPFTESLNVSTKGGLQTTTPNCGEPANLAQVAYQFTLAHAANVHVTASDESGSGVVTALRAGSCAGQSLGCKWASGGNINQTYSVPSGIYVVVLARSPEGRFSLSVTE